MIKIKKENYEMIMFDLLEGNIKEPQKSELINQIQLDEFLNKEWNLLQHTMLTPDLEMVFSDKDKLLKPVGNAKGFNLYFVSSIAASLLIFALFFIKFYKPENKTITHNTKGKNNIENHKKTTKTIEDFKETKIAERKIEPNLKLYKTPELIYKDTIYLNENKKNFEEIVVKSQNLEKIAYSTISDSKIEESKKLNIEKYAYRKKSKYEGLIAGTHRIREVWDDIPNIKINVKPKIKNYKPALDITLKGEKIYAFTTIEIK